MANYPNAATAAKFNCGLYITVEDVTAFDPGGFTIAMWLRWRNPNFVDPCIVENPGEDPYFTTSASTAWIFAYNDYQDPSNGDGTPRLTLSIPNALTIWNSGASFATKTAINDGTWHFLAFSLVPSGAQRDAVTWWLDGTQAASGKLYHDAGFATPNGKELGIGCEYANGSDGQLFVGWMAEFQIWRGALGGPQIASLMQAPPDPSKNGDLLVFLKLTQASVVANKIADSVGKHTGKITAYQQT